jgi:radical SAM-linked protein
MGRIRFASHRDIAKVWERALRIANVPMVYSEGFSPRPRIAYGLALPTGSESDCEYIDVQVDDSNGLPFDLPEISGLLTSHLPEGIEVNGAAIMEGKPLSLQQTVTSSVWDLTVNEDNVTVDLWLGRMNELKEIVIVRERKGKKIINDIKPLVYSLEKGTNKENGKVVVTAELGTQPRSLRPSELLRSIDPCLSEYKLRRRKQIVQQGAARLDPLEVEGATRMRIPIGAS